MLHKELFLIILCFCLFTMGCQSQGEINGSNEVIAKNNIKIDRSKPLREVINDYYNLEMSESWELTYEYRTPLFQQSVPRDDYIRGMKKDNKDWKLHSIKIKSISMDGRVVDIEFIENNQGLDKKTTEETKWKMIDNEWFVVDPADRGHLPINNEIVIE